MGNLTTKKMGQKQLKQFWNRFKQVRKQQALRIIYLIEKNTGRQFAIKQYILSSEIQKELFFQLMNQKKKYNHENLIKFQQCFKFPEDLCQSIQRYWLLFQYSFKSLKQQIDQRNILKQYFTQSQIWSILYSCLKAFNYLKSLQGIYDIPFPDNILIKKDGTVILNDSWLSQTQIIQNFIKPDKKMHHYLSPQIRGNKIYKYSDKQSEKANIYALGISMLQLLHMQCFSQKPEIYDQKTIKLLLNNINKNFSRQLKLTLYGMTEEDPDKRISYKQILRFIQQQDKSSILRFQFEASLILDNSAYSINRTQKIGVYQSPSKDIIRNTNTKQNLNTSDKLFRTQHENFKGFRIHKDKIENGFSIYNPVSEINNKIASKDFHNYEDLNTSDKLFRTQHENLKGSRIPKAKIENGFSIYNPVSQLNIKKSTIMNNNNISQMQRYFSPSKILMPINDNSTSSILRNKNYGDSTMLTQQGTNNDMSLIGNNMANNSIIINGNNIINNNQSLSQDLIKKKLFNENINNQFIYTNNMRVINYKSPQIINKNQHSQTFYQDFTFIDSKIKKNNNSFTEKYNDNQNNLNHSGINLTSYNHKQEKVNSSVNKTIKISDPIPQQQENQYKNNYKFKVKQYQSGDKYQGDIVNQQKQGYGILYYANNSIYKGQWKRNKKHGQGKLFNSNNELVYDGFWSQNKFNGYGKFYNTNPSKSYMKLNYKDLKDIGNYWLYYEGNFKQNDKHGPGKIYFTNGQCFIGNFIENSVEGKGCFQTLDWGQIQGVWRDGQLAQ